MTHHSPLPFAAGAPVAPGRGWRLVWGISWFISGIQHSIFNTPTCHMPFPSRKKAERAGPPVKTRAVIEDGIPRYMGRSGDDLIFAITCTATAGEQRPMAQTETDLRSAHPAFLLFGYDQGVVRATPEAWNEKLAHLQS